MIVELVLKERTLVIRDNLDIKPVLGEKFGKHDQLSLGTARSQVVDKTKYFARTHAMSLTATEMANTLRMCDHHRL